MDTLDGFRVFVAAVETGSFAGAGERLGISGKLASKYLAALEDRFGARLLQRTTRRLGMTVAGERLYQRLPGWLDTLEDIRNDIKNDGRGLSGTLRISAPVTFGEMHVLNSLAAFRSLHPDLTIDLRLSDAYADLAAEGVDLAIRIGQLQNSALIARKIGHTALVLVAAPEYLEKHGTPLRIEELADHSCIRDTNMRTPGGTWPLMNKGETVRIRVGGHFLVNSARSVRELCLAGEGVALAPDYAVSRAIEDGRLIRILPDSAGPGLDIHAVYLDGRRMPRRVRAFLDHLKAKPLVS
ncbi:LysR family transcriptional regulator [Martelella alba]|uniref:LysR family transcriptional regulator n=1 Tax=Martelella alba TaxID=2590451 RepID=A0A506U481_9HYPH|nr:LysR family transcriptional regulator [Martelella alba]TPW29193.1 LysR family transcriptional regulator [Martelella alba]